MTRFLDTVGSGLGDLIELRWRSERRRTPKRMYRPSISNHSALRAWAESLEDRTLLAAPTLFLGGGTIVDRVGNPIFVPGSQPITLLKPVTSITSDSNLVSAVVTITNPLDDTAVLQKEVLGFSDPLNEIASSSQVYDPVGKTETLTLTFQASGLTIPQTLAILQSVTYVDQAAAPTTTDRLLTFSIINATGPNAPLANATVKFATSNLPPVPSFTPAGVSEIVGAGTITLGLSTLTFDPVEDGQSILTYTVTKVPDPALGTVVKTGNVPLSNGDSLTLAELQSLQFVPVSTTIRGSDAFGFVVKDSGGNANGGNDSTNVTVPILVNTRPVLTPVGQTLNGIPVGQLLATNPAETVFTLYSLLNVTEPGTPLPGQGIAVTGVDNSHGTWMYLDTSLNQFVPFGNPTPANARLLAATAAEKILFDPATTFNGTAGITFTAWDKLTGVNEGTASTIGGATSSFSASLDTATIAVNTAPQLTTASATIPTILSNPASNLGETVSQFVTSLGGNFTDIDPAALKGIAIVNANNSNGQWQYLKTSVWTNFPAGLSDSNAFLLSANPGAETIRFVPNLNFNGKASFTFRAWDQVTGTSEQTADASVNGGHTAFSNTSAIATILVNSPPVLNLTNSPITSEPINVASNFFAVSAATVTQPDSLNDYNGGFLQADLQGTSGVGVGGSIALVSNGNISVSGSAVSFSGQPIGNITLSDGQHIKVTFTATTTPAAAAGLIQAVQYVNASQDPVRTQVVRFTVDNGQGGQSTSNPTDATVTIHRVNNPPVLTVPASTVIAPISVSINTSTLISGTPAFSVSDPDAENGIETVTVSVGHGTVNLSGSGVTNNGTASATITGTVSQIVSVLSLGVTYTPVQGFTSTDTITVVANDQGNTGDPAEGSLPANNLPLTDTKVVYLNVAATLSASAVATDLNNNPITTANAVLVGQPFNYTLTVTNANNSVVPVNLSNLLPPTLLAVPGTSLPSTTQLIPANGSSSFTFQVFATPAAVSDPTLSNYTVNTQFTVTPKNATDGPVVNVSLPSPVAYIQVTVGGDATVVAPGHYAVREQVNQTRNAPFIVSVGPSGTSIARAVTLTLSTAGSTATSGNEYNGAIPSTVTLNPGNNFTTTVAITIPDNSAIEGTKTLNVSMILQNPALVGPQPTGRSDQTNIALDILDGNGNGLIVTTTADNGDDANPILNSLRAAIKTANGTAITGGNPLVITFQIPNGGNLITVKNNPLPALKHATVLDASPTPLYPQSIIIDGANTFDNGLTIWSSLAAPGKGTTVRALTFQNFKSYAIDIVGPSGSGVGEGDVVISGDTFTKNGGGVLVNGSTGGTIGGPGAGDGNIFTLNTGTAVSVVDTPAANTSIQGNTITFNLAGVTIQNSSNVKIGGGYGDTSDKAQSLGNVITDNTNSGVLITSGSIDDSIRFNTIARDGGKGIDIDPSANIVNASTILQPSILGASAFALAGSPTSVTFQGKLLQDLGSGFKVDFYVNDVTNPGGSPLTPIPQGQLFVSSYPTSSTAAASPFTDTFQNSAVKADQYVTAVVTDASGNSSTFSTEFRITNGLVVTNTNDSGVNSLRDAITHANLSTTVQTIGFRLDPTDPNFKKNGYWTIPLITSLPDITRAVKIDGTTAGGTPNTRLNDDNAVLTVRIDAGGLANAFRFTNVSGPSEIRGLSIVDYSGAGILIDSGSSSVTVAGDFLGVSPDKTLFGIKGGTGVQVNNATGVLIGGARDNSAAALADRNVIAGNTIAGVTVTGGSGVTVSNNFLGFVGFDKATPPAPVVVANGDGVDVTLVTPSSPISVLNNVIAGNNGYGVTVTGGQGAVAPSRFAFIAGNQIGVALDPSGNVSLPLGNGKGGVLVNLAGGVVVGGTALIDRNVIGANKTSASADKTQGSGVIVVNSTGVRVVGNQLGGSGLGNAFDGVYVDLSSGAVIANNVITGNAGDGVDLIASPGASVGGNKIGLDDTDTVIANGGDGVFVSDSGNALIGNFTSLEFGLVTYNVISGNGVANSLTGGGSGVHLAGPGSTFAMISLNRIGTDKNGAGARPNLFDGVRVEGGGTTLTAMISGNLISGNSGNGIHVINTSGVTISGNQIGTDLSGGKRLDNGSVLVPGHGVFVDGATTGIMITGGNLISANTGYGIKFVAVSNSTISGNKIGTDVSGASALGDTLGGVRIEGAGTGDSVSGNTISGNGGIGLDVNGGGSLLVSANTIGLNLSGSGPLGNASDGIAMMGVSTSTIGGNFIGANTGYGINLTDTPNAQIVNGNKIGTDQSGSLGLSNKSGGVIITASPGLTVAGISVVGNTISANGSFGVGFGLSASSTVGLNVANNLIGLNTAGTFALGNQGDGLKISAAPSTAASPTTITGNQIGGNTGNGVSLTNAPNSQIQSNKIGTGADNQAVLGNNADGIKVDSSDSVTIGGPTASNVIVNNGKTGGVTIGNSGIEAIGSATTNLQIVDNVIGVVFTQAGWLARGNAGDGIVLSSGVLLATVKGDNIGGNFVHGVEITDSSATLTLNTIGIGPQGTLTAGDGKDGVHITGASTVTVGDVSSTNGNEIGSNGGAGVMIVGGTGKVKVLGNFIGTPRNLGSGFGNIGAGVDIEKTSNVDVLANVIGGNTGAGVFASNADGLLVGGNGIGTTLDGSKSFGNRADGVQVVYTTDAVIGVDDIIPFRGAPNVINSNGQNGIEIGTTPDKNLPDIVSAIRILFNKIGFNAADTTGLSLSGNVGDGVKLTSLQATTKVGSVDVLVDNNLIVNNFGNGVATDGLAASSGLLGKFVVGQNMIGTDAAANNPIPSPFPGRALGNRQDGVLIDSSFAVTLGANNAIAFNGTNGVEVSNKAGVIDLLSTPLSNFISANVIVRNGSSGILLNARASVSENFVGYGGASASGDLGNIGPGITIQSAGSTLTLNTIGNNHGSGVLFSEGTASNNVLDGNSIGGSPAQGSTLRGNLGDGISLVSAGSGNQIQNNTIIGNNNNGVLISQTSGTVLSHNFIGVDGYGTPSANIVTGVFILNSSYSYLLGNTIADNGSHGVLIFGATGGGNTLAGNFIGTNAAGQTNIGNNGDGVVILNSNSNVIGGTKNGTGSTDPGDSNVIANNQQSGVEILGNAAGNGVLGNLIGLVPVGGSYVNLGNTLQGVSVVEPDFSPNLLPNLIGAKYVLGVKSGTLDMAVNGNVIGNNGGNGIFLNNANFTVVAANYIGTSDIHFTHQFPNLLGGIALSNAQDSKILANFVAYNSVDGIDLSQSSGNALAANTVLFNTRDGVRIEENSGSTLTDAKVYLVSSGNAIGLPGLGNTIAGNLAAGIESRTGATNNQILGNTIGLLPDKVVALANQQQPVGVLFDSVGGNFLGEAMDYSGANLVSGNVGFDVQMKNNDVSNSGNKIQNNFIGTDSSHMKGVTHFSNDPNQVGVYLLNSANNTVSGNVVSGHPQAGIEVFGSLSLNNMVMNNVVGAGVDPSGNPTNPILTNGLSTVVTPVMPTDTDTIKQARMAALEARKVYSTLVRQQRGIWLNDAGNNTISNNQVLGNYFGVQVSGPNSKSNQIIGNQIGPVAIQAGYNTDGMGNFFGVQIDGASNNTVSNNRVSYNISVGIYLNAPLTTGNVVQSNTIDSNGGYGVRNSVDSTFVKLTGYVTGSEVFGSGIYVDGALNNIIGATASAQKAGRGVKQTYSGGNSITNNVQTGILLFNVSAQTNNANSILGNTITGKAYTKTPTLGVPSEYGIFLFNSISNLIAAPTKGPSGNVVTRNWIANFREFTGAVPPFQDQVPAGFAAPATTIMSLATTSPAVKRTPRGGVPIVSRFGARR